MAARSNRISKAIGRAQRKAAKGPGGTKNHPILGPNNIWPGQAMPPSLKRPR